MKVIFSYETKHGGFEEDLEFEGKMSSGELDYCLFEWLSKQINWKWERVREDNK